jgi:hypothetical protein
MEPLPESAHPSWPFPFVPQDGEHTPAAVQASVGYPFKAGQLGVGHVR